MSDVEDDRNDRELLEKEDLDLAYREYQLKQKRHQNDNSQQSVVACKKVQTKNTNYWVIYSILHWACVCPYLANNIHFLF